MSRFIKIIIFVVFILLGAYIVYGYFNRPVMTIIIKYEDVPPVLVRFPRSKVDAYYRGIYIGKVSKIELSNDQKHILFYLDIYYRNLKLPKNSVIYLGSEDLYGARHLTFYYPKNPSSELLSDGDVVDGTGFYERLDKYLVKDLQSGKLARIVSNLLFTTDFLKNTLNNKDLKTDEAMNKIKELSKDAELILSDVREILGDPQVKSGLKSTIVSSSRTLIDVNQLLETRELRQTIAKAPESIDKTIKNLEGINKNMPKVNENIARANQNIPEVNKTVSTTNLLLTNTNANLETINSKVPPIPPSLPQDAEKALKAGNCLMNELSGSLSKRFLFFRFLFGNPASSLRKCKQGDPDCYSCPANKPK